MAYDLEDSVTPGKKAEARSNIRRFLSGTQGEGRDAEERAPRRPAPGIKEYAVRINSVDSGYALDDLTEVVSARSESTPNEPTTSSALAQHTHSSKRPTSTPS